VHLTNPAALEQRLFVLQTLVQRFLTFTILLTQSTEIYAFEIKINCLLLLENLFFLLHLIMIYRHLSQTAVVRNAGHIYVSCFVTSY